MQQESKLSRATYVVPKGQEQEVHYTLERVTYDNESGTKTSAPQLTKSGVKTFEMIKRDLELQGYTVNILFHPEGKYNNEPEVKENLKDVVEEKDAEIAKLKAELAEKSEKKEVEETSTEKTEASETKAPSAKDVEAVFAKAKNKKK